MGHDDVITWKCFLHHWLFVRRIEWSPADSRHKGPVMWTFDVPLILARTNCWRNTRVVGDLRHRDALVAWRHCIGHRPRMHKWRRPIYLLYSPPIPQANQTQRSRNALPNSYVRLISAMEDLYQIKPVINTMWNQKPLLNISVFSFWFILILPHCVNKIPRNNRHVDRDIIYYICVDILSIQQQMCKSTPVNATKGN